MTFVTIILRNLRYYRKQYFAILAGTVISTAVLTGALVVGDSVRYSLGHLTDIRLGKTRFAIQSGDRFFRQQLAGELEYDTKSPVVSALQLEGMAVNTNKNTRINRVEVLGIDDHFLKLWNSTSKQPVDDEAILSRNTAEKLGLSPGDEFLMKIRKQGKAPENAPFISESEPLAILHLKVAAIADDSQMGRFSLKSNQSAPFNIFISLSTLARKVELTGSANLLLITDNEISGLNSEKLYSLLHHTWQPADAGIEFKSLSNNKKFEIRSSRIFIDDNSAKAIQKSIPDAEPVFTYLVNSISANGRSSPYSFVTAAGSGYLGQELTGDEIMISKWLATDLGVKSGDSIRLRYFKMGALRKLSEDSALFYIKSVKPISDPVFDRSLMPDFPGMSDAGNCREWETGAPVDLSKIRDKDEQYWNEYRGTPKALISIASGQKIWENAFGHATAFRFQADSNQINTSKIRLMENLDPAENGLRIRNVYAEGKSAATHSTDFGGLFLSLSFFIIASALLLIALLFSLHAQLRRSETALLATVGFPKKQIYKILFIEASLVILAGSVLGTILGVFYNQIILFGLNTLWQDAVRTSMLQMHLVPATLLKGFALGVISALLALLIVLWRNMRMPLSVMVKGDEILSLQVNRRCKIISLVFAILLFAVAAVIIAYSIFSSRTDNSELYLSAGGMVMTGGIALLYALLLRAGQKINNPIPGFFGMILRNVSVKRRRTITAVALLSIGTFSVIITGANRKTFYGTENSRQSGTGGFLFWAESTIPLVYDLNSPEGKEKYGLTDERAFRDTRFLQMLRLDGNDASCLNLNQVSQPQMLGINPDYFDQQKSFGFVTLDPSVNDQHPWLALKTELAPGIIPGLADQTIIQWGLNKKVGDTLSYINEMGKSLKVKIMGGLENSIFQGNILVSAELFRQNYPSAGDSKMMLIDGDFKQRSTVSERLEYLFQDYGMVITPASERLAQFNSVENTYLTVFMMLGGLGMLIGTIGLGIVLLRNLADRRREIAIYQAIGFKKSFILKLILTENLFLLLSGMGIGLVAAFTGILPSFFSPAYQLPTIFILVILLVILLSGFAWIYFPVKIFLHKNLLQGLRKE